MNLLITGGTGFFGRALLRHLISDQMGYEHITILTRNPSAFKSAHPEICASKILSFAKGDVCEPYFSWEGATKNKPNHIIHAATESGISHDLDSLDLTHQIVCGTENILKYAVNHSVNRFLYVSSGAVYGEVPNGSRVTETLETVPDTTRACSLYGNAKRLAENMCLVKANEAGFDCVISRGFSFVGPDMPITPHFALGSFINAVRLGKPIIIQGDGAAVRSYLNQKDLAASLLLLISKGNSGEIYNVGSEKGISIINLAKYIRMVSGRDIEIKIMNGESTGFGGGWYVPNISKIKTELGFKESYSLHMSLSELLF